MIRCAECGRVECDKNACPGWSTELQEALVGESLFDKAWTAQSLKERAETLEPLFAFGAIKFPTETPADRHRFISQFQQQPSPSNSCCQRNRDGKCCEHFCKCNRQKCRWDGK